LSIYEETSEPVFSSEIEVFVFIGCKIIILATAFSFTGRAGAQSSQWLLRQSRLPPPQKKYSMQQKEKNKENKKKDSNGFLGIYFKCCRIYGRIYKNKAGTAYKGTCPKCGSVVEVAIGEGGTPMRMFMAE
jgi:hypothetical protein